MRGWALAVMLTAVVVAPAAAAQPSASETLHLVDPAPPQAPSGSGPVCNQAVVHGIAMPGETPEQAGKAYTSDSSAAVGCPTLFRTPSPGAFNVTGATNVHLFIGCDDPTLLHQPLNNVRVWLVRNEQAVAESRGTVGPTCSPGEPMEIELEVEQPEDSKINATDDLGINVTVFGSPNTVVDNIHVLVGGNETASTVTVPGIADALVSEQPGPTVESDNETDPTNDNLSRTSVDETGGENGTPGVGIAGTVVVIAAVASARTRIGEG